ncbi:MAG TPA: hypothetical protein VEN79_12655 [Terriglobia bacterium]|nr:hypothetical protein [Terriglobia bacterium]
MAVRLLARFQPGRLGAELKLVFFDSFQFTDIIVGEQILGSGA